LRFFVFPMAEPPCFMDCRCVASLFSMTMERYALAMACATILLRAQTPQQRELA
jgi:hypothetical protein